MEWLPEKNPIKCTWCGHVRAGDLEKCPECSGSAKGVGKLFMRRFGWIVVAVVVIAFAATIAARLVGQWGFVAVAVVGIFVFGKLYNKK